MAMFLSLMVLVAALATLASNGSRRSNRSPVSTRSSNDGTPTASQDGIRSNSTDDPAVALQLYCAASNRAVVDAIRSRYEQEFGRIIQVEYGPSQTLLSKIEISQQGDLYIPADDSFIELGKQKGLIAEAIELAQMRACLAVPAGNPKGIARFEDLVAGELRVVQASTDASAIGKLAKQVLSKSQHWDALHARTTAYVTTVTDVANAVQVGAADVGVVYDAVLHSYPNLQKVSLPEFEGITSTVAVGVVRHSRRPTESLRFARYLAAHDRGGELYQANGFTVKKGDVWNDEPELKLFAGSMLRPAIEETIVAFEQREGVHVSRVYNGCGILVAQMKAGDMPDAYFACDREFMKQVREFFPNPIEISKNELVILVKKGNPLGIRTLKDLARSGIRVGIGHEKQCAMGWLTQNTLREGGVLQEVMANVLVQTPTGDMLVNQLLSGSLDAAVAYLSNASGSAEQLDAIQIEGLPCSTAVQPWAVSSKTDYPQTARRLYEAIKSTGSRDVFLAEGFGWADEQAPNN